MLLSIMGQAIKGDVTPVYRAMQSFERIIIITVNCVSPLSALSFLLSKFFSSSGDSPASVPLLRRRTRRMTQLELILVESTRAYRINHSSR
jgi:hypothetical protein